MLKKVLNAVISLLLPWSTLTVHAQSDLPRFETAGQFALMSTEYRNAGVGGRFSYNATEYLSFDSEVDYFPQDKYAEGKKTLGLFGVKIRLWNCLLVTASRDQPKEKDEIERMSFHL